MRQELSDKLNNDFSLLYPKDFYFEIDDGWFDLIYDLSAKIELILISMLGTQSIISKDFPIMVQMKEKWGILRVYIDNGTPEIYGLIQQAEQKSASICEACGVPGELKKMTWRKTYCNSCYKGSSIE